MNPYDSPNIPAQGQPRSLGWPIAVGILLCMWAQAEYRLYRIHHLGSLAKENSAWATAVNDWRARDPEFRDFMDERLRESSNRPAE